jgi:hypothetical protein
VANPLRLDELFRTIDTKDTTGFLRFVTADARFQFGNAPALAGREAIGAAVGGFFQSIRSLRHVIHDSWSRDDSLVCRGEVTYTRHDGAEVTVPFVNVFYLHGTLIGEYRIYVDLAPLFAPAGAR